MLKRLTLIAIAGLLVFVSLPLHVSAQMSPEQKRLFRSGVLYFNYDKDSCQTGGNKGAVSNVYILGDSITVGAAPTYQKVLGEKNITSTISGVTGRSWNTPGNPSAGSTGTTGAGKDAVDQDKQAISQANAIVVALGTNGYLGNNPVDETITKIRTLNATAPIYWINVANGPPGNSGVTDFNKALEVAAAQGKIKVIPWSNTVDPNGNGTQNPLGILADGTHPTADGYNKLVTLVASALDQTPASSTTANPSTASLSQEANRGYNGETIFSDAQLQAIKDNQPFYEKSAQKVGIPWQMIAVIHGLEHGFQRDNPGNGQGAYQLYSYTGGGSGPNAFRPAGPISDEEFQRQTDIAAQIIKDISAGNDKANQPLEVNNPKQGAVGDTFFGYNGRAGVYRNQAAAFGFDPQSEGYQGSPYVMNKVDAQRDPNTAAPNTWGQIKSDGGSVSYPTNQHFGAWPMFAALAGIASGGGGACGSSTIGGPVATRIVQIAQQEFATYGNRNLESDGTYHKYTGGGNEDWCADFVSWVLNEAKSPFTGGLNGGWRIAGVTSVMSWFQANGGYHAARSGYAPQPGDVVIFNENMNPYPQHVNIVVAVDTTKKTITTIGGNENGTTINQNTIPIDAPFITGYGTKNQ